MADSALVSQAEVAAAGMRLLVQKRGELVDHSYVPVKVDFLLLEMPVW